MTVSRRVDICLTPSLLTSWSGKTNLVVRRPRKTDNIGWLVCSRKSRVAEIFEVGRKLCVVVQVFGQMKKSRIGKPRKVQSSHNSQIKGLLRNLVIFDAFPYRPAYEFNGYRSLFGAICSILFMFAVILNIFDQIRQYETAPPNVKVILKRLFWFLNFFIQTTLFGIQDYRDERVVPFPTIAVLFQKESGEHFYDEHYFKIQYLQGDSFHGQFPIFSDAGRRICTVDEPTGNFRFSNAHCPISDMGLQGADNLPSHRFVRVSIVCASND